MQLVPGTVKVDPKPPARQRLIQTLLALALKDLCQARRRIRHADDPLEILYMRRLHIQCAINANRHTLELHSLTRYGV